MATAVGTAASSVLMLISWPLMESSVFFLFLAAATVSAIYGGLGPGLTATVLSALASDYFFLEPYFALFSRPEEALRLVVFLEVRNSDTYGVLKLTPHPSSYDWRFVPEPGKSFAAFGSTGCH